MEDEVPTLHEMIREQFEDLLDAGLIDYKKVRRIRKSLENKKPRLAIEETKLWLNGVLERSAID